MDMKNEKLQDAVEEFIIQRINDCGGHETSALQDAWEKLDTKCQTFKDALSPELDDLLIDCENALMLVSGETMNCYYRAGFSDAVSFLFGWRDRKWN